MVYTAYNVTKGPIEIHPETFQPLLPVTIYLPLEAIHDASAAYGIDDKELAMIIGTEIINGLKAK